MTKKLKTNILVMLSTGALYMLLKAFEFETPGIEKILIVAQIITFMTFGISVITLMIQSTEV